MLVELLSEGVSSPDGAESEFPRDGHPLGCGDDHPAHPLTLAGRVTTVGFTAPDALPTSPAAIDADLRGATGRTVTGRARTPPRVLLGLMRLVITHSMSAYGSFGSLTPRLETPMAIFITETREL